MKKCFLLKETHKTTVFMHQLVLTKKICWRLACFELGINFRRSLMVSVGVSALGRTAIHFIDPGVKVNGHYYREVLKRDLFADIRKLSDHYIFQQDSAPAHRARETIELLAAETPDFISPTLWPPNSPDLNSVDYTVWSVV